MSDATELPPPSLARRLAALVYDTLLVLPLVMLSVALALGLHRLLAGPPAEQAVVQLDANLVRAVALLTVMLFYCGFWLKSGQTLGMQAWRIKLVNRDGGAPSVRQAVGRCLAAVLSAGCLGLGYLWCLVDRHGRYWHDHLSGTELVLLPRTKKR